MNDRPTYQLYLDEGGPLSAAIGAVWVQKKNEPDKLTFTYPAPEANSTLLCRPRKIYMYDTDGYMITQFDLTNSVPHYKRDGNNITVEVQAQAGVYTTSVEQVVDYKPSLYNASTKSSRIGISGLTMNATETSVYIYNFISDDWCPPDGSLCQIDSELIILGELGNNNGTYINCVRGVNGTVAAAHAWGAEIYIGKTIKAHCAFLLENCQQGNGRVSVGVIMDSLDADQFVVEFSGKSLFECLKELYLLSGSVGQMVVTPTNEFIWVEELSHTTYALTVGEGGNVISWDRDIDDTNLCTRLYLYGAGLSAKQRVKLSDAYGEVSLTAYYGTGFSFAYTDPKDRTIATLMLAGVVAADSITLNGLEFTAHATTTNVALRQFSVSGADAADASALASCINNATYGIPNVVATCDSNVLTLRLSPPWDYVENNTGVYGVIVGQRTIENVSDANTLKLIADAAILELSEPVVTWSVEAVDLSIVGAIDPETSAVYLPPYIGGYAHLVDAVAGIDVTERIVGISRQLDTPTRVSLELGKPARSVEDILTGVTNRIEELRSRNMIQQINRAFETGDIRARWVEYTG